MYDRGEIMTSDEQNTIIAFIYNKNFLCSHIDGGRVEFRFKLNTTDIPIELWKIKQRILDREKLRGYNSSTYLDDIIAIILPGGSIPPHIDKNSYDGNIHVRFNVFIQIPEDCTTYYDYIPVESKERHYVLCRSGIDRHWTNTNKDIIPRISLSYGFMLPVEKIAKLYILPTEHNTYFRNSIFLKYILTMFLVAYNYIRFMRLFISPYAIYSAKVPFLEILDRETAAIRHIK